MPQLSLRPPIATWLAVNADSYHSILCNYMEEGYSMMRTEAPKDLAGRGVVNLARTTPELPCGRVTLPQMTRILVPRFSV